MWISKLELTNFKSFLRQSFEFPQPADGKNVVLIGGMNGFGKTSLLEAIYLCLYGKDAIVHLGRAGLRAEKGYPTFLENAFNGEAKQNGRDSMSVSVQINFSKRQGLLVTRKWFFKGNGLWGDEEATFFDVKNGVPGLPRQDGLEASLPEALDQSFVPPHVAPFFFFDGEQVSRLADQSRVEQIKQGLEGLLGVVLLRGLADRLRQFEQNRKPEGASVDEGRLQQLHDALMKNEAELEDLRRARERHEVKLESLRHQRDLLFARITSSGGGAGDIATAESIISERSMLEQEYRTAQKSIEDLMCEQVPFHLVSQQNRDELLHQLVGEQVWVEWDGRKRSLEPEKERFKARLGGVQEPVFEPELTEAQLQVLTERLEAAWQGFYSPPPEDAKPLLHSYLFGPQRDDVVVRLRELKLGASEVLQPVRRCKEIQLRLKDLKTRLARLEGIDRDGTLANIRNELAETTDEFERLTQELREVERSEAALSATVNQDRANFERERERSAQSSPAKAMLQKSERIRKIIDEVIPAAFALKVEALGQAMTKVYKQLAHKDQVKSIEVRANGSARILDRAGEEILFDRSAGENQLFATALIAGLAHVSGVRAPMVVDTPLGRLDSIHRKNILDFWVSDKQRQVILLSQDEEIDTEWFEQIRGSVLKTYLLTHEQINQNVGRSSAIADKYFSVGDR